MLGTLVARGLFLSGEDGTKTKLLSTITVIQNVNMKNRKCRGAVQIMYNGLPVRKHYGGSHPLLAFISLFSYSIFAC